MQLDPYLFSSADWRIDGPDRVRVPWMRLRPDGTVQSNSDCARLRWVVQEDALRLLEPEGVPSYWFDRIAGIEGGQLRMAGATAHAPGMHTLVQLSRDELPVRSARRTAAVVIRTHMVNSKLLALWSSLAQARNFDVYVNIDETRGPSGLSGPGVLRHSVAACVELGLWQQGRDDYFWYFGDYPIYTAMRQLPGYDTFIQVEYDVHFTGEGPVFLEALIDRVAAHQGMRIAAVAPRVSIDEAQADWPWAENARKAFGKAWGCFFPFVLVTRAAADFLLQMRRGEAERNAAPVHCEAFLPSALRVAGLTILDINRIIGNAHRAETFGLAPMPLGLPAEQDGGTGTQMHHPVYDRSEFVGRAVNFARSQGDTASLAHWARHPRLWPELRGDLLQALHRIEGTQA